tara:strand:+ start:6086 stop:7831 length:1746 start_codon:yes stop_codon:yes gene_type:complete
MIRNFFKTFSSIYYFSKNKIIKLFFLIIISMVLEYLSISIIIPLITALINPDNIILNKFNVYIQDFLPQAISQNIVLFFVLVFFFIIILRLIATVFTEIFIVKYSRDIENQIIYKIMTFQFIENSLNILKNNKIKIDFSKLILSDIPTFTTVAFIPALHTIKNILLIMVLFLIILLNLSYEVIFVILALILTIYTFTVLFKKKLQKLSKLYDQLMLFKYEKISQFIKGFKIIKINNLNTYFIDDFYNNERKIVFFEIVRKIFQILPKTIFEFVVVSSVLIFILLNENNFEVLLPILALIVVVAFRAQPMFVQISSTMNLISSHIKQITTVQKIMLEIKKNSKFNFFKKNKKQFKISNNNVIKFKNVSFRYSKNKSIFQKVNLNFKFNKIYGIVGDNGSGKSTFADLVSGFNKPSSGKITLNDIDINNPNLNWQNNLSYLNQNSFLFNQDIKTNITLTKFNQKKINSGIYENVLNSTNLKQFINSLPKKDLTLLGNLKDDLSGGQIQKINLARIFYANSQIIILDEPTSSIDKISIKFIKREIKKMKKNRLIFIISHSKNLLSVCDEQYKIKNLKLHRVKNI